jgi:hypothetical protein
MNPFLAAALVLAAQTAGLQTAGAQAAGSQVPAPQSGPAWTWTLYEGGGPVVLANEIPDTPRLRVTLQCDPPGGLVDITVYDVQAEPTPRSSFARLTSGVASTTSEARIGRGGRLEVVLRTDHPLFAAFVGSGDLSIMAGETGGVIKVERSHLAKLRRFADRCSR